MKLWGEFLSKSQKAEMGQQAQLGELQGQPEALCDLLVCLAVESAVFKCILVAKGCRMIARGAAQVGHCDSEPRR